MLRSVEGELYVTGDNSKLQLGIDRKIKRRVSPSAIEFDTPGEKILIAQANGYFNVVYSEYGQVYSWGDNTHGQLGTEDMDSQARPINITKNLGLKSDESVVQISLGPDSTILLLNNGQYISFGNNQFSQLGLNNSNKQILKPE